MESQKRTRSIFLVESMYRSSPPLCSILLGARLSVVQRDPHDETLPKRGVGKKDTGAAPPYLPDPRPMPRSFTLAATKERFIPPSDDEVPWNHRRITSRRATPSSLLSPSGFTFFIVILIADPLFFERVLTQIQEQRSDLQAHTRLDHQARQQHV